ncbi:cytochrome c3 family protein [Bacteroidota bacterium]
MKTPTIAGTIISLFCALSLQAQNPDTITLKPSYYEVNPYVDENEECLKCHGEQKYVLYDEESGLSKTEQMYPDRIIHRELFYTAQHKSFSCTDCHSYDYNTFPHQISTRTEEQLVCMDCHGYDETYAHYHFEDIEAEYHESIHNMEEFTCWKCHEPHSYKAFMRNAEDLDEAVIYDNNMCLNCHADYSQFFLLTDRSEIDILKTHDWLPNQEAHFLNVRCIECHTEINDSILIAHKILPMEEAVQNCTECHSKDSRLLHTLYKFQISEARRTGLINSVIVNNAFVIGANRIVLLNWLSFIIFGFTLLAIAVHVIMRIRNSN